MKCVGDKNEPNFMTSVEIVLPHEYSTQAIYFTMEENRPEEFKIVLFWLQFCFKDDVLSLLDHPCVPHTRSVFLTHSTSTLYT